MKSSSSFLHIYDLFSIGYHVVQAETRNSDMYKMYWQIVSTKTGLQNVDSAFLNHVLNGNWSWRRHKKSKRNTKKPMSWDHMYRIRTFIIICLIKKAELLSELTKTKIMFDSLICLVTIWSIVSAHQFVWMEIFKWNPRFESISAPTYRRNVKWLPCTAHPKHVNPPHALGGLCGWWMNPNAWKCECRRWLFHKYETIQSKGFGNCERFRFHTTSSQYANRVGTPIDTTDDASNTGMIPEWNPADCYDRWHPKQRMVRFCAAEHQFEANFENYLQRNHRER